MSQFIRRATQLAGFGFLAFMAVWLGSVTAYDLWLARTCPRQADPLTNHGIREHAVYITPDQHAVLLMPITLGWLIGGLGVLSLAAVGYSWRKDDRADWRLGAAAAVIATLASVNPYGANLASLLGSGHWDLSP